MAGLCGNRSAKLPWSSQTKTSCWVLNCFACMLIGQKSLQCIWVCVWLHGCVVLNCICVCTESARVYIQSVCVCACAGVCWKRLVSYYSCNGLHRFGGYLFLLVNCEADSIEGLGQFKWAFSQITSVIICVQVPGCFHQDRAWEAPKFNGEEQIWPQY